VTRDIIIIIIIIIIMQADIFFLRYQLDLYTKKRKLKNSRYPTFLLKSKYKAF
jgi:hypothetical protein